MQMQTLSLDDNRTIQAIGILADVLDGLSGPGGLDTVVVSRALRQVIATRSYPALDFAAKAFSSLHPQVRARVQADAENAARDAVELRGRVAGFLSTTPTTLRRPPATTASAAADPRASTSPASPASPASAPAFSGSNAKEESTSGKSAASGQPTGFLAALNNRFRNPSRAGTAGHDGDDKISR
jgi:hypothetical protein